MELALKPRDHIILRWRGYLTCTPDVNVRTSWVGAEPPSWQLLPYPEVWTPSYWALWENRPDWLAANRCTGLTTRYRYRCNPSLRSPLRLGLPEKAIPRFTHARHNTVADQLVRTLVRLEAGEKWSVAPPALTACIGSTISGWRH